MCNLTLLFTKLVPQYYPLKCASVTLVKLTSQVTQGHSADRVMVE